MVDINKCIRLGPASRYLKEKTPKLWKMTFTGEVEIYGSPFDRDKMLSIESVEKLAKEKFGDSFVSVEKWRARSGAQRNVKSCIHCGEPFFGHGGSKYCSEKCHKTVLKARRQAEREAEKRAATICRINLKDLG